MSNDPTTYLLSPVDAARAAAVAARFDELVAIVRAVVPSARVEHVGATAVPGMPTKGDLDVQVRVHRERFDAARAALASRFRPYEHAYGPPDGASFDDDHPTMPAGLHLTVIDSDADEQWVFRELLLRDPQLHASFVQLRHAFDGRPMDEWRSAKGRFYERLKSDPRFARTRALAHFPATIDLTVQWGEMDAFDHVNNVVYFRWFESARMVFFTAIDFTSNRGVGPILAATSCRYKLPLRHGDVVTAAARVVDLKDDRFMLEHALWSRDAGRLAATGEAEIVAYDHATKKKARLPDDVRARIDALRA